MPRTGDEESDLDSNAPLLPQTAPAAKTEQTSAGSRAPHRTQLSLKWWHPVLAGATIVLLGSAISVSGITRTDSVALDQEDPKWPTFPQYRGPTPTGSEALAAATSYPSNYDSSPLDPPLPTDQFNILHNLGNLSPWRTVNHGLRGTAQVPQGCTVEQVQLLHRHGSGTETFARKVSEAKHLKASGKLSFLNDWSYKLGAELLTPFGREELFNLGVSFRVKYGHLLETDSKRLPVFRTESQDRMLNSAKNFAAGFFGFPFEEQYHQLVTIEWPGFNNTLAPYMTCPNAGRRDLTHGHADMSAWINTYLADTAQRLQAEIEGVEIAPRDAFNMQLLCAYELVALGGSEFCDLFTEEEFRGFEYAHDLQFFGAYSYGQPAQVALGKGWVQEWLARTLRQPLSEFNSTTNSTLHNSKYFPLDQKLYVDASHDTVISAVITSLNFSTFARSGPLPTDRIPTDLSFVTSSIAPFSSNLHSQILDCPGSPLVPKGHTDTRFVRWILNDGVVPISNMQGCEENDDGMCHLETYLPSLQKWIESVDFDHDCYGDWDLTAEPVLDGRSPRAREKSAAV
ncbi:hypothetical protein JCM11491_006134 [Sporobolomyces phaffii]